MTMHAHSCSTRPRRGDENVSESKRCEYTEKHRLNGDSAAFFRIPCSVVLDSDSPAETLIAFSYFSIKGGIDGSAMFSLNSIVEWSGRKPDKHKGMVNDRMLKAIMFLEESGYISIGGNPSHASFVEARIDRDMISNECENSRYAVLYVDEIMKILSSDSISSSDKEGTLHLLSYLRMMMPRRWNALFIEETGIEDRRRRYPEVYGTYYKDMSEDTGISQRSLSRIAEHLKSHCIVYSETLPKTVMENGKWLNGQTLFCNFYKREGASLLAEGEEYYMSEIERKKDRMNKMRR